MYLIRIQTILWFLFRSYEYCNFFSSLPRMRLSSFLQAKWQCRHNVIIDHVEDFGNCFSSQILSFFKPCRICFVYWSQEVQLSFSPPPGMLRADVQLWSQGMDWSKEACDISHRLEMCCSLPLHALHHHYSVDHDSAGHTAQHCESLKISSLFQSMQSVPSVPSPPSYSPRHLRYWHLCPYGLSAA